jgi:hypothetical protein
LAGTRYLAAAADQLKKCRPGIEQGEETIIMKAMTFAAFLAATTLAMPAAYAQQVPATPADVAKPGGKIPGAPRYRFSKR